MDQIANHPIPQDVTGFKFRLIGSITVKQFLYLLGAGAITVVFWLLPIPIYVRIPFMMFSGGLGTALAFVPIEGRAMDVMVIHFLKALPSENRYIYRKRGANFFAYEFSKAPKAQKMIQDTQSADQIRKSMLLSQLRSSSYRPDKQEQDFMNNIRSFFEETAYSKSTPAAAPKQAPAPQVAPQSAPAPVVQTPPPQATDEKDIARQLGQQALELQKQIKQTQVQEGESKSQEDMQKKLADLQAQLEKTLDQRDSLEKKVVAFESQSKTPKAYAPSESKEPEKTEHVHRVVGSNSQLQAGFPMLPDAPNVMLGIIKDPRGKVLPNILVEVVDRDNVPVRAFKTNSIGQFASATSLPDGDYTVFFEDPKKQHEFDTIEISLNGEVFHPLEVFSVDSREKLRRELFAN